MNILKKIKAVFTYRGKLQNMAVESAEIRGNEVFLHPADDPEHTVKIESSAVDILINPGAEVKDGEIFLLSNQKLRRLARLKKKGEGKSPAPESLPLPQQPQAADQTAPDQKATKQSLNEKNLPPRPQKRVSYTFFMPKQKTITLKLFDDEYEMLMDACQEKGYKKTEYLLACMAAAKKKSLETAYKQYYTTRMEIRQAAKDAAKRAQEEQGIFV